LYKQVAELNGTMKDQALQAIPIVNQLKQGTDISKIEKDTYQKATSALQKKDYTQARSLFQHVIDLKVPDSGLASKAQTEMRSIDQILQAQQQAEQQALQQFNTADQAQRNNDLQGALAQFKAIAEKPGPKQTEAQQRVKQITDQIAKNAQQQAEQQAQQQAQQQFNAADQAQQHNDLPGALAQFKAIAGKPGPKQIEAQQRVQQITQLIAEASKPKPEPPKPEPPKPEPPKPAPQPVPTVARIPKVDLIPSGDYERWTGPVSKGDMIPDNSVEGGLKPINLAMPPLPDAPAKAFVTFIITIDQNGNVTPTRKQADDYGLSPQVMAAAKKWRFNPPMVKGKPVSSSIQVKVTF
jgi:hypothetical protein